MGHLPDSFKNPHHNYRGLVQLSHAEAFYVQGTGQGERIVDDVLLRNNSRFACRVSRFGFRVSGFALFSMKRCVVASSFPYGPFPAKTQ